MAEPNTYYDINMKHPDASKLSGNLIGEIQKIYSGETITSDNYHAVICPEETYMLHLVSPHHPSFNNRLTLPQNGHIVVSDISHEGWEKIGDIISKATKDGDHSWKNIEEAIAKAPELKALRVMNTSFGLTSTGAYR